MRAEEIIDREFELACRKIGELRKGLGSVFLALPLLLVSKAWSAVDWKRVQATAEQLAGLAGKMDTLVEVKDLTINEECIALAEAGGTDD
jgi:hypothetical protein